MRAAIAIMILMGACRAAAPDRTHATIHAPEHCPICRMYALVKMSVVRIETPSGLGSGSFVDDKGRIVTNRHVVGDYDEVMVVLFDGRRLEGTVRRRGDGVDLALVELRAPVTGLAAIPLGATSDVEEGEEIYVIGHPLGLGWSITRGLVSRIRGTTDPSMPNTIQIDAPVSPGNSGGPLLTAAGRMIGVVTTKVVAKGAENLGFACPAEKVAEFLMDKH